MKYKPNTQGQAANARCCNRPLGGVEIPGLYDGVAFWACRRCGKHYRRWAEIVNPDLCVRIDAWATEHGVDLLDCQ